MRIDLHMHSLCSDDGEFTPEEIVKLAKQEKLDYIAITDHNSVAGVSAALVEASRQGISLFTGVELDCVHEGRNFHLLGYGFDHQNPAFSQIEENIVTQEKAAAAGKVELITAATGIGLTIEEVLLAAKDGVVTGELIAEILLKRPDAAAFQTLHPYLEGGERSDNPYVNFYWDFFSQGKPAYVPIQVMTLSEAVLLIHASGGIAVLAHPGQNLQGDFLFLEQIIETGIDGIEVYSSYHKKEEAILFDAIAKKHGLLITCGSDFHGKIKPSISLCGHGGQEAMEDIIISLKPVKCQRQY